MSKKQRNNKNIKENGSRMNLQIFGENRNRKRSIATSKEARIKNGKPTGNPPEEQVKKDVGR